MPRCKANIVFMVADDLGYGDLGLFGNNLIRTPHLDALGRDSVVLTQHYSASPLCAPARVALLTGRYNHRPGAGRSGSVCAASTFAANTQVPGSS